MNTIAEIAENVTGLLWEDATELGRSSGFIQRERKFDGSTYARMMVCGAMGEPQLSYTHLAQYASIAGLAVSAQGIAARFTPAAARFLAALLERAVSRVIESRACAILPILAKFTGVYIRDSSVISLPASLANLWPGVGDVTGVTAAMKLQVRLNYSTGVLDGPTLYAGRAHDRHTPYTWDDEPAGSLSLADLGYFNLDELQTRNENDQYVVTRYKQNTALYTAAGERLDLVAWLQALPEARGELQVEVGRKNRVPMRLLVQKVPPEVAEQRRRKLNEYARKKQVTPRRETYALTDWILVLTNAPAALLTFDMVLALLYLRWQVELLFKLWKSYLYVDEWRSANPWRILCEIYAKLIAAVISQWIYLIDWWRYPDRSLPKAFLAVRKFAATLAGDLRRRTGIHDTLQALSECIRQTARTNKRGTHPATFQTLSACCPQEGLT